MRHMPVLVAALMLAAATGVATGTQAPLQFNIREGQIDNAFYQQGPVAAHLLLSSGGKPRILATFPAGNSGAGIWFEDSPSPLQWQLGPLQPVNAQDGKGRTLHGVQADATVHANQLRIRDAALGSIRVLRDYQLGLPYPDDTKAQVQHDGDNLRWSRDRLDGAPGYAISLQVDNGRIEGDTGRGWTILANDSKVPLRLRIRALTGETPLTPFASSEALLKPDASQDTRSRNALRFLSYQEKFLAGSWRFDTYFGRDTLMSLRLLMPVLQPAAVEAGLAAVLDRLSPQGQVAHEEDIGEFAILQHRRAGAAKPDPAPIYDYKMIDGDVMLAPVAAAWLLDSPEGHRRAAAFLARKLPSGQSAGAALQRNFELVKRSARAFARAPVASNLWGLHAGSNVGQWRDSEDGLAGGRYPYDVNAVLVPAALDAIARLHAAGLLTPYVAAGVDGKPEQDDAAVLAARWQQQAPPLFDVALPLAQARKHIAAYARSLKVDPSAALASLPSSGELHFHALALDAQGKPIPVLHSDEGFNLLFGRPSAAQLQRDVQAIMRPFPAGLRTDVGILVANAAHAPAAVQRRFGSGAYHGSVVWSWQQALLAAGLQRQLQRGDLPAATAATLRAQQRALWRIIHATDNLRTSELWSWRYANGRYQMAPFGQNDGDADESNAAQLWSTVYLAVQPPTTETGAEPAKSLDP